MTRLLRRRAGRHRSPFPSLDNGHAGPGDHARGSYTGWGALARQAVTYATYPVTAPASVRPSLFRRLSTSTRNF